MSVVQLEKRVRVLEGKRKPNPDTYVLTIHAWGLDAKGSVRYLVEHDGSPRGRFVRMLIDR